MGRAQAFVLVRRLLGGAPPKVENLSDGETRGVVMTPAWRGGGTKLRPRTSCEWGTGGPRASRTGGVFVQVKPARGDSPVVRGKVVWCGVRIRSPDRGGRAVRVRE